MSDSIVKQLLVRLLPAAFLILLGGLVTASSRVPAEFEKKIVTEKFSENLPAADRLLLLQINSAREN